MKFAPYKKLARGLIEENPKMVEIWEDFQIFTAIKFRADFTDLGHEIKSVTTKAYGKYFPKLIEKWDHVDQVDSLTNTTY